MNVSTSFPLNVKRLRLAMRVTQEQLAVDSKITTAYLSRIETGKSSPTLKVMEKLAAALGIQLAFLISERISISMPSDDELEVDALAAHPAVRLARQPLKLTGRPRKNR